MTVLLITPPKQGSEALKQIANRLMQEHKPQHNVHRARSPNGAVTHSKTLALDDLIIFMGFALPESEDGLNLISKIRKHSDAPLIVVAETDAKPETITAAFNHGADGVVSEEDHYDYIMQRIKTAQKMIARHHAKLEAQKTISYKGLELTPDTGLLTLGKASRQLTPPEAGVLFELMMAKEKPIPHKKFSEHVGQFGNQDWDYIRNNISVVIKKLRKFLEEIGFEESQIHSVRGVGYQLATTKHTPDFTP